MRVLIAATCVALLLAMGYFFWSEWDAKQAANQMENDRKTQAAAAELTARGKALSEGGRCTALATALTNSSKLPIADLPDARACAAYHGLTAFERNSFDLHADALR